MYPELEKWLDAFSPEVIFSTTGSLYFVEAALAIKEKYNTKLVVHLLDDWYDLVYRTGIFKYQRKKFLRLLHQIVEEADYVMSISEDMAEVFEKRFGVKFHTFHNGTYLDRPETSVAKPKDHHKITYFGTVWPYCQLFSLLKIAETVEAMEPVAGRKVQLEVVTSDYCIKEYGDLFEPFQRTHVTEFTDDQNQFFDELGSSDLILLPSNFDDQSISFFRYSIPGKLPGYLNANVPIFVFGPAEITQVKMAKEHGWGYVLSENSSVELEKALTLQLTDQDLRKQLVQTAGRYVAQEFDLRKIQDRLQNQVRALVN
jgi:glycosyltransferase involved in cell wall biosynthesis